MQVVLESLMVMVTVRGGRTFTGRVVGTMVMFNWTSSLHWATSRVSTTPHSLVSALVLLSPPWNRRGMESAPLAPSEKSDPISKEKNRDRVAYLWLCSNVARRDSILCCLTSCAIRECE